MRNSKLWRVVVGFGAAACILLAGVLLILACALVEDEEYGWRDALLFYLSNFAAAWIVPVLIATGYFVLSGLIYGVVREASVRGLLVTALLAAILASVVMQVCLGDQALPSSAWTTLLRTLLFAPVMLTANATFAVIAGLPWRAVRMGWSA